MQWYCGPLYYLSRLGSNLLSTLYFSSRYAPQWEFELPGQAFELHPFVQNVLGAVRRDAREPTPRRAGQGLAFRAKLNPKSTK